MGLAIPQIRSTYPCRRRIALLVMGFELLVAICGAIKLIIMTYSVIDMSCKFGMVAINIYGIHTIFFTYTNGIFIFGAACYGIKVGMHQCNFLRSFCDQVYETF